MAELPDPRAVLGLGPRARVLLLGTFHFVADSDYLKREHPWDPLSPEHQAEIEEVVERLAAFRPTKVCLERPAEREEELNRLYHAYREGARPLGPGEEEQLGFRLAARIGHDRVYAVDAQGLFEEEDGRWPRVEERARAAGRQGFFDAPWAPRYKALHRHDELLKTRVSLREYLLYLNAPEHLALSHGIYLDIARAPDRFDYTFVDYVAGWWYDRNVRIFHHLQHLTESPADRLLVIIGAGHVPLLRHCVQTSLDHELVEVAEVLG